MRRSPRRRTGEPADREATDRDAVDVTGDLPSIEVDFADDTDAMHRLVNRRGIEAAVNRRRGRRPDHCADSPQGQTVRLDRHILAVRAEHEDRVTGPGCVHRGLDRVARTDNRRAMRLRYASPPENREHRCKQNEERSRRPGHGAPSHSGTAAISTLPASQVPRSACRRAPPRHLSQVLRCEGGACSPCPMAGAGRSGW